jgi:transketolase
MRTELNITTSKVAMFEATLTKEGVSLPLIITRDELNSLQRSINQLLQDGYKLIKAEKVEKEQVTLS